MIEIRLRNDDASSSQPRGSIKGYLDLYKDEPVLMELSFAEVQDITSKNSSYSKSFRIPGTTNNNDLLDYFFNPNSIPIDFDVRKKYNAEILYNGYELLVGYIRLNQVDINDGVVDYTINFYAQVGDLAARIADKKLNELNTTLFFDHQFSWLNIAKSWDINYSTGATGLLNGAILYPLLNRGYSYETTYSNDGEGGTLVTQEVNPNRTGIFDISGIPQSSISYPSLGTKYPLINPDRTGMINIWYFNPAVQIKRLFECIAHNAGYKIESNFFDNDDYFNKIYLPLTFASDDFGFAQNPNETWIIENTNAHFLNSTTPNYIVEYTNIIEDNYNRWVSSSEFNFDYGKLIQGPAKIIVEFDYEVLGSSFREVRLEWVQNLSGLVTSQTIIFDGDTEGSLSIELDADITADSIDNYSIVFVTTTSGSDVKLSNIRMTQVKSPRGFYATPTQSELVDISKEFGDEYRQIDIISSIVKQFNLVIIPKPNEDNVLIVEPFQDWVGSGRLIDWTEKVNRAKTISMTDTTKFVNGSIQMEVKEGKDFLNESFKKENPKNFQSNEINLNTDYKNKDIKIESIFSISMQERLKPGSDYTLPVFYQSKEVDANEDKVNLLFPVKTTPMLIYYAGQRDISVDRGVKIRYNNGSSTNPMDKYFPQSHYMTYYPVATFSQNKSIGFNKYQVQGDYKRINIHHDAFTLFYEDTINDYLNEESRFLKCELYLTPEEVKEIDYSEQIIIDGARWRINKLSAVDLRRGSLVQGEFIKLFKDIQSYTGLGTDKIVLERCSNPEELIYTTIQLSPGIVQFAGLVVRINGNCYYVYPPSQYDSNLTYQIITPDNQNGIPLVFANCIDCGEEGGPCAPITDIQSNYASSTPVGAVQLAVFRRDDCGDPQFCECEETYFYWDCLTNSFLETNNTYTGQPPFPCNGTTGWDNEYGTPITIPSPVNRPGYLVEECCYDPVVDEYYDIYWEKQTSSAPIALVHKLCCANPPATTTTSTTTGSTTTTTTLPVENNYLVLDCETQSSYRVSVNQALSFGFVYYLNITGIGYRCVEYITTSSTFDYMAQYIDIYDNCSACSQGGGSSSGV